MRLSAVKKLGESITGGMWVDDIPMLPGVRLKVCGSSNPKARAIAAEMISVLPRGKRGPDDLTKIERRQIVEVMLVDWSGFTDDSGAELPYSREKLETIMADPDVALVFIDAVNYAAVRVAELASESAEADAKN